MVSTARILVVEDDAIVARDLKGSLTKMGYFVTGVAAGGEEALEMAGENRPDLVLMDITFDGDIDGIETAQRMRDRYDVPVIYLTAFGDQATFARAKQTLPLAYVLKPFDPKDTDWTQLPAPVDGPRKSREAPWQESSGDEPAELRAKDGTTKLVKYDSVPIVDRKGNVRGVVFAFRP